MRLKEFYIINRKSILQKNISVFIQMSFVFLSTVI